MSSPARADRPFRDDLVSLDPPRLLGSRCPACAVTSFPPRAFCPGCRSGAVPMRVPLSTDGRITSFTVVRQAPAEVEVPYVLAQVDLPEDRVRLLSGVVGVAPEQVRLDQRVALELCPFATAADGARLLGYRFRVHPAEVAA